MSSLYVNREAMTKMANVNCPNCGASLPVEPEKVSSALYCMHCGTRITDFDDLLLETVKHQQQMERDTLLHEQEMERIEAEAKLETKRARRIAVEKGTRAAVRSTNGCIGGCVGFITKSILTIVLGTIVFGVGLALFIKFAPVIFDFVFKILGAIFDFVLG